MSQPDTPTPKNPFEPADPLTPAADAGAGGPELDPAGTVPADLPKPQEPLLPPAAPDAGNAPLPPAAPGTPTPPAAPEGARPAPEYGEYAPEGWSWDPETGTAGTGGSGEAQQPGAASPTGNAPVAKTLPNVPHNLGVGSRPAGPRNRRGPAPQAPAASGSAPQRPAAAPGAPAPYVQQQPMPAPPVGGYAPMAPGQFGPEAPRKRTGDRITTAILLAVGAIANFFFAQMFFALEPTFAQLFEMYGLGEFTAPAAIGALSTVGAITMLSLWALALVGSLLLIRAGKPSWYVPVIAAVLSVIALFIILGLATQSVPELFTAIQEMGVILPSVAP